jgi:hypothetical protein
VNKVKHNLAARGLTIINKLPPINPTVPLFSAKYLVKPQTLYRLLFTGRLAAARPLTDQRRRCLLPFAGSTHPRQG